MSSKDMPLGARGTSLRGPAWARGWETQRGHTLGPAPAKAACLEETQAPDTLAGEKLCREGLEVLVGISQQRALAAIRFSSILGHVNGSRGRRRVIFPICSALHALVPSVPNINKLEQTWKSTRLV